mgnify:CR=1 FL=1
MPASAQYYLSCTGCGSIAQEKIGDQLLNLYGETDLEVREEAIEQGWWSDAFDEQTNADQEKDFCPACVATNKHLDK